MIPLFFFLFGIIIGSFLNVCITRIPEGISIITPGSRCPRCQAPIKPYDNIPVLGWFLLRGKCRSCGLPIEPLYPIVEFLSGAIFVVTYYEFGITLLSFKWLVFTCLLLILIITDLRVRLLPDAVNWFGFGLGLAFATKMSPSAFLGFCDTWFRPSKLPLMAAGILDGLVGAASGSLLLWGAAIVYRLVRKREGMGMGDVKMMAMIGVFLGFRGAFLTILFGTMLGSVVGISWVVSLYLLGWKRELAVRAARRGLGDANSIRWAIASQYQLPLGTFLGIAAFLVVYAFPWVLWRVFS